MRERDNMANEFSRYIQQQMDDRGWNNAELARRSGLEKQHVSKLRLNGEARSIPDAETIAGLARAFGVSEREVLLQAARAVGVRVDAPAPVATVRSLASDDLIAELSRRLAEQPPSFQPAPLNLNRLEAHTLHQADDLMTSLRADAETSRAAGNSGLAELQTHLAAYVEGLLSLALETNGGSHSENGPAQTSDQSERP